MAPKRSCSVICTALSGKRSWSVVCMALSGAASGVDNERLDGAEEEVLLGHLHGALRRSLRYAVPKKTCSVICTALSGEASGADNERLNGAEEVLLGHQRGIPTCQRVASPYGLKS